MRSTIRVHFRHRSTGEELYFADLPCPPHVGEEVEFPSRREATVTRVRWKPNDFGSSVVVDVAPADTLEPA